MTSKFFLFLISINLFPFQSDTKSDWKLKKVENGIFVYTRDIPNSPFKSIKVTSLFEAKLSQFICAFKDIDEYKNWVYGNTEAYIIKQINEGEGYYYSRSDAPWPVSDRDVVMHNITEQDPVTKTVTSKSNSVKGLVSEKEDCVRLYSATSLWVLKPLNKNTIDVSYEITVDPSGNIPSWLANLTMDTGPTHTISKLKEQIKKPEYANKKYNHIIDY